MAPGNALREAPVRRKTAWHWHIGADRTAEFLAKGFKERWVFPHRAYYLPKCGPDGLKLASRIPRGALRTFDEVADDVIVSNAWGPAA